MLILTVCTCPWHSRGIGGTALLPPCGLWGLDSMVWLDSKCPYLLSEPSCCGRSDDILSSILKTCFRVLLGGAGREGRLPFWEALSRTFVSLVALCDKRVLYYTVSFSHLYSWAVLDILVLALSGHAPVTSPRALWAFPESSLAADMSEHISL